MGRKKIDVRTDPLAFVNENELELPAFNFGAVCKILGLEPWRLQKFLDSPRYQLNASGQLGEGKGSRRWFKTEDVYRIGIANFLAKDGFAPKLIAAILQRIHDSDLLAFDEHGGVRTGITLSRARSGPKLDFFRPAQGPEIRPGGDMYYVLDLSYITGEIDRRIEEVTSKKGRRPE